MVSPISLEKETVALREELRQTREKLFRLDQLKRNFTALVASELGTPVTILLGYTNLLETQAPIQMQESVAAMAWQANQLKRLVDSIIIMHQIDMNQLQIFPAKFPLSQVTDNVIQMFRHESTANELVIDNQVLGDVYVEADRDMVGTILANLLSNAVKFSPKKGRVVVCAQTSDSATLVNVSDQGQGIEPEEQRLVFDRFYQAGDPIRRRHSGIGLGLAVARSLVELHGGKIWLDSMTNQGSTIHFTLPKPIPKNGQPHITP